MFTYKSAIRIPLLTKQFSQDEKAGKLEVIDGLLFVLYGELESVVILHLEKENNLLLIAHCIFLLSMISCRRPYLLPHPLCRWCSAR